MDLQVELPQFLDNSTILLDTNFFIDSYPVGNREIYGSLIGEMKSKKVAFVSTSYVKHEFIISRTIDVVKEKLAHFNKIVENILPYRSDIDSLVPSVMEEYKQYIEGLSITDLILATYLKKYRGLYLMTRDHKDFPTTVFKREFIVNVELLREIRSYGMYRYMPEKKKLKENVYEGIPF